MRPQRRSRGGIPARTQRTRRVKAGHSEHTNEQEEEGTAAHTEHQKDHHSDGALGSYYVVLLGPGAYSAAMDGGSPRYTMRPKTTTPAATEHVPGPGEEREEQRRQRRGGERRGQEEKGTEQRRWEGSTVCEALSITPPPAP